AIELAGLREEGVALVEIFRGEEAAPLADRRGEDRRVDAQESARIVKVVRRLLELAADARDRDLPRRAQPERAVVEEKIDAVLLRLNRIVERARADDRQVGDAELVSARHAGGYELG